jgi:NNP family nitrate/nitrite transporter-like MFS transporter
LVTILLASALPAGLAGTITNAMGLYFIRFAMGVAGGAFVPAQVWITAWFDKRVMGTATAFAAGWGDQGVGCTLQDPTGH